MRALVQYWHSEEVPEEITALIESFRKRNPEMRHLLFDEASAEGFIAEHLSPREVAAFRTCGAPAMQSDYLRCCAVLALGGIYADADLRCVSPLEPLLDGLGSGELFGWAQIPDALSHLGLTDRTVFGDTERPGAFRWVENGFFAFSAPGHPLLELALRVMTANIETRATESLIAVTGPGVFTSFYLLRELGSFEAFVAYAGHGVLKPVARRICEIVGDHGRLMRMLDGVDISPVGRARQFVEHTMPSYKETDAHWMRWPGSIFR
jgi:mannosyltransferase OCH1-like enzyme